MSFHIFCIFRKEKKFILQAKKIKKYFIIVCIENALSHLMLDCLQGQYLKIRRFKNLLSLTACKRADNIIFIHSFEFRMQCLGLTFPKLHSEMHAPYCTIQLCYLPRLLLHLSIIFTIFVGNKPSIISFKILSDLIFVITLTFFTFFKCLC